MSTCEYCNHESATPYDFAAVQLTVTTGGWSDQDRTLASVTLCRRCLARFESRGRRRHESRLWGWVERAVRDAVKAEHQREMAGLREQIKALEARRC